MGVRIVRTIPEEEWGRFVVAHPLGNIFHSPEMFRVFAQAEGHQPMLWAAVDEQDRPLALLPVVQVTVMTRVLRSFATRAVAYGSMLCHRSPAGHEALAILLREYNRAAGKSVLFTELRNLADLSSLQPALQALGFKYEDHLNYLVDLSRSPEAVLQSMGRRTRKQIRRALRQGQIEVEEVDQRGRLGPWYALLQQSYAFAQIPLADRTLFEAAFDELHPRGMVKFLLAKVSGRIAAASVELIFKDVIYGWYSGVNRKYSSYVPSELLVWYILRWGAQEGYRLYDFGGAGRPDEQYGVRDFKAKFGGDLVCYGRNTLVHTPARLAISKVAYQGYRFLSGLYD